MYTNDLSGATYGRLTIRAHVDRPETVKTHRGRYVECQCVCGTVIVVSLNGLKTGHTKSCGCLQRERVQEANARNHFDAIGKRFGRLVVLRELSEKDKSRSHLVECFCDCGNTTITRTSSLKRGNKISCGCRIHDGMATTHGMTDTPTFNSWWQMVRRCTDPKAGNYAEYGGSGITVCDRWRDSFENFLADMGERPSEEHSIDRRDNTGNYESENCRWATPFEQMNNRRNTVYLTYRGETKSLSEWAKDLSCDPARVYRRLQAGWSSEEALLLPKGSRRKKGEARDGVLAQPERHVTTRP